MKRRLTRANVKEKIRETRRVLAKLRFLAKEVPLLLGRRGYGKERALGWLPGLSLA